MREAGGHVMAVTDKWQGRQRGSVNSLKRRTDDKIQMKKPTIAEHMAHSVDQNRSNENDCFPFPTDVIPPGKDEREEVMDTSRRGRSLDTTETRAGYKQAHLTRSDGATYRETDHHDTEITLRANAKRIR